MVKNLHFAIRVFFYLPLLGIILSGWGVSCSQQTTQLPENKPPNILFLFADDQRSQTIRELGNSEVITPHLDSLVRNGTSFPNAYIMGAMNGAVCAPSRAMLMTGRSLFNIDPTGNTIDSLHMTMPKALEQGGYHTYHIGKWHNGRDAFTRSFMDGSKIFFGGMHRQYEVPTYEFMADKRYAKAQMNPPSPKHSSELYADAAVDFLKNYQREAPFFMYVAFQAPHDPREMPQRYLDLYDTAAIDLPPNFLVEHPFDNGELDIRDEWLAGYPRSPQEVKANIAAYYAMITHLDAQIGRIMKALAQSGRADNTIVIFSGDNGLAVGQHGLMGKQNLYEHSIKVPLVFAGPDIPAGQQTHVRAYLSDLFPTFCEWGKAKVPSSVQGKSLTAAIQGDTTQIHEGMFYAYKNFQRAARNDRWKILKYNVGNEITTQLFDLDNDPYEMINLAPNPTHAGQLAKMETLLGELMRGYHDKASLEKLGWGVPVLPAWKDKVNPVQVDHLRELAEQERAMRGFGSKP
ncbi:MAG: sulfatase-like hydrolase/transferase [Bacteroidota bacterium]